MTDTPPPDRKPTYEGGIEGVLQQMEGRREALTFSKGEALPPLDVDFAPWKSSIIPVPADDPVRDGPVKSSNRRKTLEIREELAGNTELTALHGLLIAHLRKRDQPEHVAALFHRMWAEEADHLLAQLDQRWLVSALTTFGDHGQTDVQRRVGHAMTVLFGTMKLYESERRYSGFAADRPFPLKGKDKGPLPMEMDAFHLPAGGLDVNMLGRLWLDAGEDAVLKPLARHLLDLLIHDPRTVFRRLRIMRKRKERRDSPRTDEKDAGPEPKVTAPVPHVPPRRGPLPTWGVVTSTNAPLGEVTRFAAHYLTLGATRIELFLDAEAPEVASFFADHPQIRITTCDGAYWQSCNKDRPEAHQLRQAHNATRAYRASDLDFLAHFDVDEFLIPETDIAKALRFVPEDCAQTAGADRRRAAALQDHPSAGRAETRGARPDLSRLWRLSHRRFHQPHQRQGLCPHPHPRRPTGHSRAAARGAIGWQRGRDAQAEAGASARSQFRRFPRPGDVPHDPRILSQARR